MTFVNEEMLELFKVKTLNLLAHSVSFINLVI